MCEPARVLFDAAARDDRHTNSNRSLRGTSRGSSRAASGAPPWKTRLAGEGGTDRASFRGVATSVVCLGSFYRVLLPSTHAKPLALRCASGCMPAVAPQCEWRRMQGQDLQGRSKLPVTDTKPCVCSVDWHLCRSFSHQWGHGRVLSFRGSFGINDSRIIMSHPHWRRVEDSGGGW